MDAKTYGLLVTHGPFMEPENYCLIPLRSVSRERAREIASWAMRGPRPR